MSETNPANVLTISGRPNSDMDQETAGKIADAVSEYPVDTLLAVSNYSRRGDKVWAVEAHFGEPPDLDKLKAFLTDVFDIAVGELDFTSEDMPDKDWVTESLQGLAPIRAGRFFVYGSHDQDKVPDDAVAIEIDASIAFGTGHHGTTEGCLLALEDVIITHTFKNGLDLGCGTGLLAIGAAKALQVPILATDIDPEAVQVATENIRINGVNELVRCETATGFSHPAFKQLGPFDLILANILAGPLINLARDMAAHITPGGVAILSGLLIEQSEQVESSYQAVGFRLISRLYRGEWAILTLVAAY